MSKLIAWWNAPPLYLVSSQPYESMVVSSDLQKAKKFNSITELIQECVGADSLPHAKWKNADHAHAPEIDDPAKVYVGKVDQFFGSNDTVGSWKIVEIL